MQKTPKINNNNGMTARQSRHLLYSLDFVIPILILAVSTILTRILGLDLLWEGSLFTDSGWYGSAVPFFDLVYDYGTWPAILTAITGLAMFIVSFFSLRVVAWRIIGLFLLLVMLLGPGLLVNSVLKQNWGRPRPRNVVEFRGKYAFEEVLTIDLSSPGQSFPSGHASMGFYFFALFFVFRSRKKLLAVLLFILALSMGLGIGAVRMAQGGHFPSDVLWSGGLVYLCCALLYYLLKIHKTSKLKDK